jgi:hypothetical protein
MNTSYVQGQTVQVGDLKPAVLWGYGPASYNLATGDILYNPGNSDYIEFPSDCTTQTGNYSLTATPISAGTLRAGAPSPSQSGWMWVWKYSGEQGVKSVVQNAAGVGMTPGTVVPIVFSGGGGAAAAGTVTVLTATTISIQITNSGQGYTTTPTATVTGTGGTPPTLTVTTFPAYGIVPNGTNLSQEVVQFGALVSQL